MKIRGVLLAGFAALVVAACQPPGPEDEPTTPTRNVVVQVVQPQPLSVRIKLPVVIMPREMIELRAASAGVIESLRYKEGDVVPASSVPDAEWFEVDEYRALQPDGVELTAQQINQRNLAHVEGIDAFARISSDQLHANFVEAQENYDQAVRDLHRTEEYAQSTGAQLDNARTRRNTARAQVTRALSMIEDTYVENPMEGVLTELMRKEGEYVNPGELIGKVAVMDRLVAQLELPEANRRALAVDDKIQVTIGSLEDADGKPEKRLGTVTRIDHVAHPQTHSFTVEIEIDNKDLALPAGVFGTVRIAIYQNPTAQLVPLSAINLIAEKKTLFVASDDGKKAVELEDVKLGRMSYQWVEILSPNVVGKRVVTFGAQNLTDGDQIEFTEKDPYVVDSGKSETQP